MILGILDFLTRLVLIPIIYLFILAFIPEAIKDVKQWKKELLPENMIIKLINRNHLKRLKIIRDKGESGLIISRHQ